MVVLHRQGWHGEKMATAYHTIRTWLYLQSQAFMSHTMAHQVFSSTTRLLALPEASLEYHTSKTPHWGDWPNDLLLSFSLFCFFNQASTRMGLSDHNDLSVNKLDILWGIALGA